MPSTHPLADTCRLLGVGHRGGGRREGKLGDECCGKRCCAGGGFVRGGSRTEHSPNCRRLLTQKSLGKSLADRGKGAHRLGPTGEDFDHSLRVRYSNQKIAGRGERLG